MAEGWTPTTFLRMARLLLIRHEAFFCFSAIDQEAEKW